MKDMLLIRKKKSKIDPIKKKDKRRAIPELVYVSLSQ